MRLPFDAPALADVDFEGWRLDSTVDDSAVGRKHRSETQLRIDALHVRDVGGRG
jgi:hypothetical protein